jgi:heme exporter protein A
VREVPQEFRGELVWLGHKVGCKNDLTLLDNLRFERALRPPSPLPLDEVLERLRLTSLSKLPMRALSAGQQRRVSLARLLMSGARLWLMDEPFTHLDRDGQALVAGLIAGHLAGGGVCLVASHQALALDPPPQRLTLS